MFALAAFGGMKRGKDDFALDDAVFDLVGFKRGNVHGNAIFDQFVGQARNVMIATLDRMRQHENVGRQVALFHEMENAIDDDIFNLVFGSANISHLRAVAAGDHEIGAEQGAVDKPGHGLRDAIGSAQCAALKRPESEAPTPHAIGKREKPRIGALELVETLTGIAQDDHLKLAVRATATTIQQQIAQDFDHQLEEQRGHVLALVQDDDVVGRQRRPTRHVIQQQMADSGIDGGFIGVMFHRKAVKSMDIYILQTKSFDFFFNFETQLFVVRELQETQAGEFAGQGQNGRGLAGSSAGLDNDVASGLDVIQHDLLFVARLMHFFSFSLVRFSPWNKRNIYLSVFYHEYKSSILQEWIL